MKFYHVDQTGGLHESPSLLLYTQEEFKRMKYTNFRNLGTAKYIAEKVKTNNLLYGEGH